MIKCVIQVADIHIRNVMRHKEYAEQLTLFEEKCKDIASKYEKDEVRIVICGDLVHQKNTISNELMIFTSLFIRRLEQIAKVIVFSGNHDLVVNNSDRQDTLTALFQTADFSNSVYLDMETGYMSGVIEDENITWALYSIHDNYNKPELSEATEGTKVIGLYHGTIVGAKLNNGTEIDCGLYENAFDGCDAVMAGDIHKRQVLNKAGVDIVYPGSLIQQTFGETVTGHGFVVWDIENMTHKFVDLESRYGLYDVSIKDVNDVDEDKEHIINY